MRGWGKRSLPHYEGEGGGVVVVVNRGEIPVHLCRGEQCRTVV